MWNVIRGLSRNKQFKQGAQLKPQDFRLPFEHNMNLLTAMFQIRKWFILNTPHKIYAQKYTNQMAHLHNELNYQHSRLLLRRGMLVFASIFLYFTFIDKEEPLQWKDTFDLKFNQKIYGSLTTAASEGRSSLDQ